MKKLNKVHITLSPESKRNIIKDCGKVAEAGLIADLVAGENGKINGDNLDLRITTNDMRIDNRNEDLHYFASDFVMDRVVEEQLQTRGGNTV